MTREIIPIVDEASWLALRAQDITSTAMSALFGLSPYATPFEVYHAHKSGLQVPFETNERMKAGNAIEPYAAKQVADHLGATVRKLDIYARILGERIGSSFDYELTMPDGELVLLELKAVDHRQHAKKWLDDEAPPHIEIQLQHQLECIDKYERGIIAAFTGIYDFQLYERDRDREMGAALRKKAAQFWADVDAGREPSPDFTRDKEVIDLLYRNAGGEPIDKTSDAELDALVAKYDRLGGEIKVLEEERAAAKAEIHRRLENAGGAYTAHYKVTTNWTKDTAGKLITQEMVGEYVGGRKGYRQCLTKKIS